MTIRRENNILQAENITIYRVELHLWTKSRFRSLA